MSTRADAIFVSYRRADSRHAAGRLVDRLASRFGSENLFLDVDSITLGRDFVEVLTSQVEKCEVMLVVIGPDWLTITDDAGGRRLDSPADFVRVEVEAALSRDIHVIPILVDGAMPVTENALPESLQPLARRQAIRLDHESFVADAERLADALEEIVPPARARTAKPQTQAPAPPPTGPTPPSEPQPVLTPAEFHEDAADYFGAGSRAAPVAGSRPGPDTGPPPRPRPRLGWFALLAPAIFAGIGWLYFFAFGLVIDDVDLRYSVARGYFFSDYVEGTRRVIGGELFFAGIPVALALLWILLRLVRRRLTLMQFALVVVVYVVVFFGAAIVGNETLY